MKIKGDYTGLSLDYLIDAGALKTKKAPIGDSDWSVEPLSDTSTFSINLTGLSEGECQYFATAKYSWASKVIINDIETNINTNCFSTDTNKISFIVE